MLNNIVPISAIPASTMPARTIRSRTMPIKSWVLGLAALGLVGCFDNSDEPPKVEPEAAVSAQVQASAEAHTNTQVNTQANTQANTEIQAPPSLCNTTWYQAVEDDLHTGDGQGHGPDLGSTEWRSVVEFKLNIRDDSELPKVESDEWCRYIDEHYLQAQD